MHTHDKMALNTVLHHCHVAGRLKLHVHWLGCPDFGDDDPCSWISYDNNKNINQVVTNMQAHRPAAEQSEEEEEERKGEEEEENENEDEEVLADDYKGTSHASESDEEQRRVLQEKQQISALMKKSHDLLTIFTAKPSEECANQPCTFGEVRAGFKAMQMLLAGTLSDLIVRMNALTHAVEAGMQSRELTLREKLMLGIPVPKLKNLPADRGPYTAALSVIMARPIISQIEQWTKVNYHLLFMEHPEWSKLSMYLRTCEGRTSPRINEERWQHVTAQFFQLDKSHLANLFSASYFRFWNVSGLLWLTLDESMLGFRGNLPFTVVIPHAAFGNLEMLQRYHPHILFIMSAKETDTKTGVFSDMVPVYNMSTFFKPISVPRPEVLVPLLSADTARILTGIEHERRLRELKSWTKVELITYLKETLGASGSGNKDVLIRRILSHEGPAAQAVAGRLRAFLFNKATGRLPQVALYKLLFNFVDRLDVLLSYIPFPWVIKNFDLLFVIWLVRVTIVATYTVVRDQEWNYVDSAGEYDDIKSAITTFVSELAEELEAESS
eukprot:m51a1_g8553 hypothetical protein (554) ;mRNA; r:121720-135657